MTPFYYVLPAAAELELRITNFPAFCEFFLMDSGTFDRRGYVLADFCYRTFKSENFVQIDGKSYALLSFDLYRKEYCILHWGGSDCLSIEDVDRLKSGKPLKKLL